MRQKSVALAALLIAAGATAAVEPECRAPKPGEFADVPAIASARIQKVCPVGQGGYLVRVMRRGSRGEVADDLYIPADRSVVVRGAVYDAKRGERIAIPVVYPLPKTPPAFEIGSGKEVYYLFTDPECPFCRDFEKALATTRKGDYRLRVYLLPLPMHKNAPKMAGYILSRPPAERAETAERVMNGSDRGWRDFNLSAHPEAAGQLKEMEETAAAIGVRGTPTLLDASGRAVKWPDFVRRYGGGNPDAAQGFGFLKKLGAGIETGRGPRLHLFCALGSKGCDDFVRTKLDEVAKTHTVVIYPVVEARVAGSSAAVAALWKAPNDRERLELLKRFAQKLPKADAKAREEVRKGLSSKEMAARFTAPMLVMRRLGVSGDLAIFDDKGRRVDPGTL